MANKIQVLLLSLFDAEPMPRIEDDLFKFNNALYISELEITKAYH